MKYATTFILTILIGIFAQSSSKAQNIDRGRMNRDMRISKKIIGVLFTPMAGKNEAGVFRLGENDYKIHGTYLPEYGVLFVVNNQSTPLTNLSFSLSGDSTNNINFFKIKYKGGTGTITKTKIINRIKYFLRTYGPTIGQLDNNDRVTVIYQSNLDDYYVFNGVMSDTTSKSNERKLPSEIIVSAKEANIQALTHGSINKNQFNNRLRTSTSNKLGAQHHDIKIMATILKTEFQNNHYKFNISDPVHHLYVKDLGALFFVDASYGGGFPTARLFLEIKNNFKKLAKLDTSNNHIYIRKYPGTKVKISEFRKQKKKNFKKFLTQLKQTLVDYGRTIKSISPGESIFLMVNITDTGIFPNNVKLQIKESVLQAYNHGKISREQAIDKIRVRKY